MSLHNTGALDSSCFLVYTSIEQFILTTVFALRLTKEGGGGAIMIYSHHDGASLGDWQKLVEEKKLNCHDQHELFHFICQEVGISRSQLWLFYLRYWRDKQQSTNC